MNKQKLISVLQSRIAKRRYLLSSSWKLFKELPFTESVIWKERVLAVSLEQKQDKAILRQLILDERELKELKKELSSASVQVIKLCDSIVRMDEEIVHLHKVTMDGLL